MKTFLKHLLIDFAIVFGNMFLSHGLFGLTFVLVNLFRSIRVNFDIIEQLTLFILYAIQILINILLYKIVLKKVFSPPKQKSLPAYFLLPIAAAAIWIGVLKLLLAIEYEFDFETYFGMMLSLLPLFLPAVILVSIIYHLLFKKHVGEVYYAYILSVWCIITVPLTFFTAVPML